MASRVYCLARRLAVCLALFTHAVSASPIISHQKVMQPEPTPRKLTGKFLHISDFHPDLFYKPYTSTDDDISCHRGSGSAGFYGAETSDCDSPVSLVEATFKWIAENIKDDIDFVTWTGDSARHDSDEEIPRHATEVLRTNRWIADKFAETFSDGADGLVIPIIPNLGNNDFLPHNIFRPGPNEYLDHYLDIWHRFIPEEQRHSFQYGGWFYVEVIPNQLVVFSLNTMYFFDRNAGVDGCAAADEPGYAHLEWLRVQLQRLRERGMKAILIGHVPPARTESKRLWDETCWQKYTLWLRQYRDVVTASLYGHMNIDHFLVADAKDVGSELSERGESIWDDDYDDEDVPKDELSIESKGDYLQNLRSDWSRLPKAIPQKGVSKKELGHRHGNKWGERYSLAIVNPSIVPNYFPTIRIYEYNVTGFEDAPTWSYSPDKLPNIPIIIDEDEDKWEETEDGEEERRIELRRDLDSYKKKSRAKAPKKPSRPHDPDLIIPSPPSKTAAPGPAYSPQPLTLVGFTQYFANLTRLNNAPPASGDLNDTPGGAQPLPFEFEVEYSTFSDKWYRLKDLTVRSYVKLASRIAQRSEHGGDVGDSGVDDGIHDSDINEGGDSESENADENGGDSVDAEGKHKKKKDRKKRKSNKLWLKFLSRAFIGTVPKKELRKWDD